MVQDIIIVLDTLPHQPIKAVRVAEQIMAIQEGDEPLSPETLLAMGPEIETALHQANHISQVGRRIVKQCLAMPATLHPRVPVGF